MDADATIRLKYAAKYAQSSNYWKNSIGMNKALKELKVVEQKQDLEKRLRAWIEGSKDNQKVFGNMFQKLEKAYNDRKADFFAFMFLRETFLGGSNIFNIAYTMDRWMEEKDEDASRNCWKDWRRSTKTLMPVWTKRLPLP